MYAPHHQDTGNDSYEHLPDPSPCTPAATSSRAPPAGAGTILLASCGGGAAKQRKETTVDSSTTNANATSTVQHLYFPPATGTWEAIEPESTGWHTNALDDLVSYAGSHNSQAVMLLQGGRIVLERYFDDFTAESTRDIASAQKSVTSFLFGCAVSQGIVSIDDSISKYLGTGWSKAPAADESTILIKHLLTMTSGLDPQFNRVAAPGSRWFYNTFVYQLGLHILAKASNTSGIQAYAMDALGTHIGWQQAHYNPRRVMQQPNGEPSLGLQLSARDSARFGLACLANAAWDGHDLIKARDYWGASINTSQSMNPAYGYLWWLNGKSAYRLPGPDPALNNGPLISAAPPDLYAAMGAMDNRIYVIPSRELVVVRLGNVAEGRLQQAMSPFDASFWGILARALPA